jgi:hypothetical protein
MNYRREFIVLATQASFKPPRYEQDRLEVGKRAAWHLWFPNTTYREDLA